MKEYFNFSGTAKRQEFWAVHVIAVLAVIIGFVVLEGSGGLGALVALGIFIATLWAVLAVSVKRLRDAGLNVWWMLILLVPYVGTVATIVFGCIGSVEKPNNQQ